MTPDEFVFSVKCGDKSGTAFLISANRAITAYHVVNQHTECPIILTTSSCEITGSLSSRINNEYKKLDVALIDLDTAINLPTLPVFIQYNVIVSGTPWSSRGFPKAKHIDGDNILDDDKSVVNQQLRSPRNGKFDLELEHPQKLDDYSGYSGAPFLINGAVAGIINRQLEVAGKAKELNALSLKYFCDLLLEEGVKVEKRNTTDFLGFKKILNQSWFQSQIDRAILDLGVRYSPTLNVELEIARNFDFMLKNNAYTDQLKGAFEEFISALERYNRYLDEISNGVKSLDKDSTLQELKSTIGLIKDFLKSQCEWMIKNPAERIVQEAILQKIGAITKLCETVHHLNIDSHSSRLNHVTGNLRESVAQFSRFISSAAVRLANTPYLLLDGQAGTGKSHLIADVASNHIKQGLPAVLLLGQQFTSEKAPWAQITSELLQLTCNGSDLLKTLNSIGEDKSSRVLIAIDAINEGQGKRFWQNHITSFVTEFKQYPWLCLVLSIRSTYLRAILPAKFEKAGIMERLTHHGFEANEEKAIRLFFEHYQIKLPRTPLLNIEFKNPLFLKLYCEGLFRRNIHDVPADYGGISSVINYVLENADKTLGNPNHFDYSDSAKVIRKIVEKLISFRHTSGLHFIPYDDACRLANEVTSLYTEKKGIIEHLIHEGILLKNNFWKSSADQNCEGVILAYEKFDDHFTATMLINTVVTDLNRNSVFREGGDLFSYIIEADLHQGLIEALSVQIPEKLGYELAELIDDDKKSAAPIMESFLDSLLWRRTDSIRDSARTYLESHIFADDYAFQKFIGLAYCVAGDEKHPFNAYYINEKLFPLTLANRDAVWAIFLVDVLNSDHGIARIFSWILDTNFHLTINKESVDLVAVSLSWLFTTTDIELRDVATRALVILLRNRMPSAESLLNKFSSVNDPYVYERVLAAIYGAILNSEDFSGTNELCGYIYNNIFLTNEIYPNVLVRDYARNILEYALYKKLFELDTPEKIRPPYRSTLPTEFPSNEETDALKISSSDSPYYLGQNAIFNSMITEYGRGIGGYGDFGRYTFQAALRCWSDVDANAFSNYACKMILDKFGYDASLHGEFDRKSTRGDRQKNAIERIGKKYQWLALYELIARIADNIIINIQYQPERDEQYYQGPWENYLRKFDPTFLGNQNQEKVPYEPLSITYLDWADTNDKWLVSEEHLPDPVQMIDGGDFVVLETNYSWQSKDAYGFNDYNSRNKSLWYQVRSYLVKNEEYDKLFEWLKKQNFMGRWMPEGMENYSVFALEHYWSPAYLHATDNDESGWREITGERGFTFNDEIIGRVICTTESHRVDGEEGNSFMAPARQIFHGMNLDFSAIPGKFFDKNGQTIIFDPSMFGYDRSELLVRKSNLQAFLEENDMKIIWTVLGEKQILGGGIPNFQQWLEFSGVYSLIDGSIHGQTQTFKRSTGEHNAP